MKKLRLILSLSILAIVILSCNTSHTIFDENTDNYIVGGGANWTFENGELTGQVDDTSGYVMTKVPYTNFILELEFYPDSTINSGVFVRCSGSDISFTDCYEINIWDLHPNQDYRTGAIVMKMNPLSRVETINRWNTYKIKCVDDHIEAWVNGVLTADMHDKDLESGYIGLQAAATGIIKFRNIEVTHL